MTLAVDTCLTDHSLKEKKHVEIICDTDSEKYDSQAGRNCIEKQESGGEKKNVLRNTSRREEKKLSTETQKENIWGGGGRQVISSTR